MEKRTDSIAKAKADLFLVIMMELPSAPECLAKYYDKMMWENAPRRVREDGFNMATRGMEEAQKERIRAAADRFEQAIKAEAK